MVQEFDPYHRWLGIPLKDQPPDHYRLLGINRFEEDLSVIESAADRQMAHLRTFQSGKHSAFSQRLLNEVAAAKIVLLNATKKGAYDDRLRQEQTATQPTENDAAKQEFSWDETGSLRAVSAGASNRVAPGGMRPHRWPATQAASMAVVAAVLLLAGIWILFSSGRSLEPREQPHKANRLAPLDAKSVSATAGPDSTQKGITKLPATATPLPASSALPKEPVSPANISASTPVADTVQQSSENSGKPETSPSKAREAGVPPASEDSPEKSQKGKAPDDSTESAAATGRLREPPLASRTEPEKPPSSKATKPLAVHPPKAEFQACPRMKWIDLLGITIPDQDRIDGDWAHGDNGLSVAGNAGLARLSLPVVIEGSYDLLVEFTRRSGDNDVNLILPVGRTSCVLMLSGWSGKVSGLRIIDGKDADANVTGRRPGTLVNGHRYRVMVNVHLRNEDATIRAFVDGKPYIAWSGKMDAVSMHLQWKTPDARKPAVGASSTEVDFHVVRFRLVSGKATARPSE